MKKLKTCSLFLVLILFSGLFVLPLTARATEIPVGTLLYRTSGDGKMYGTTTDKILDGSTISPGHTAIYIGDGKILEAVNKGVVLNDLKHFIYLDKGEEFIGAKIPSNFKAEDRLRLKSMADFLGAQNLAYDADLSHQKGPGNGEWICTGVTEKIYESLGFEKDKFRGMDQLEYNPANYFIDITPDGYDNSSLYNEEFDDHFSENKEYSKISKRKLISEGGVVYNGIGKIYEGDNYFFFPYTQFLQPSLKDVEVDINQISSNFNEDEVRGKALVLVAVGQGINNNVNNFKRDISATVKTKLVETKVAVSSTLASVADNIKSGTASLWSKTKDIFKKKDGVLLVEDKGQGEVLSVAEGKVSSNPPPPEQDETKSQIVIVSKITNPLVEVGKKTETIKDTGEKAIKDIVDNPVVDNILDIIKEVATEEEKIILGEDEIIKENFEDSIDFLEKIKQIHPFNPWGQAEVSLEEEEDVVTIAEPETTATTSETENTEDYETATTSEEVIVVPEEETASSTSSDQTASSTPEVATSTESIVISPVLISEFVTRGPEGAGDEFVELYNFSTSSLDISNWRLLKKSATGETWINKTGDGLVDATIPALGFYLLTSEQYSLNIVPDYRHTASFGLADDGGHILVVDEMGNEIDKVAYGIEAMDPETSPITFDLSSGLSAERKAYASSTSESMSVGGEHYWLGNSFDSNDNSSDFVLIGAPNPQNTASLNEPVDISSIYPGDIIDLEFINSSLTENSVQLVWTTPANASLATSSYYDIRYEEVGKNDTAVIDWSNAYFQEVYTPSSTTATQQSLLLTDLKSNAKYIFAIKVFNGYNWSELSNQIATTTIAQTDLWSSFYDYHYSLDNPFSEAEDAVSALECSYTSDLVTSDEIFAQTFVPSGSVYSSSEKVLSSLSLMMKPVEVSDYSIDAVRICSGDMVSATGTNPVADWNCDNPGQELIADMPLAENIFSSDLGNYQWRNFVAGEYQLEWESANDNHFIMIKGHNLSFCHNGSESDSYAEGRAVTQYNNIADFVFATFQALFLF